MKKTLTLFVAVCMMVVCFVGCGTPNTDDDMPVDMSVDIIPLLSSEEVRQASGIAVGEPIDSAEGAVAYFSEDNLSAVYVGVLKSTKEEFETMRENLSAFGLETAPNLGEEAVWCVDQLCLLVYANGMTIDVCVSYGTERANDSLLAARQIVALLIEKL